MKQPNYKIKEISYHKYKLARNKSSNRKLNFDDNRLSHSQKSLNKRRRKKKRPEFDLSLGNPLSRSRKRSKGFVSSIQHRQAGIALRRKDYSATFIRNHKDS